jgi:hypothetical protein
MKILLATEGKHEPGAVQAFVKRLVPGNIVFELDRVSRPDIHAHHGKGQGHFKRAVRWLLEAKKQGVDALIFLVDEDGRKETTSDINQAQSHDLISLPRAFGVAIRTFDAWMLADEKALSSVLGRPISRQPDPETIGNPKQICIDLHNDSNNSGPLRDIYTSIAEAAEIHILETRCPKGFAPFASRIRELAGLILVCI